MDRRKFIAAASATLPALLAACNSPWWKSLDYDIEVNSLHGFGHRIHGKLPSPPEIYEKREIVIVGGGIAGITAACEINGKANYLLLEAADRLGGTSSSRNYQNIRFAEGAHYELSYPEYYGSEVLEFLQSQKIIRFSQTSRMWNFNDRQYVISNRKKGRCFDNGQFREDILPENEMKRRFTELILSMEGKLPLPSRGIDPSLHSLNNVSFDQWLKSNVEADDQFIQRMDYHMKDDWGGGCSQVSALAGVHYFGCRPYYRKVVELFSPPSGNAWFAGKFSAGLPEDRVVTGALVTKITPMGDRYRIDYLDSTTGQMKGIESEKVIFAANKHTLKYVLPEASPLFQFEQAPWLVINFILDNKLPMPGFWQNEMITPDNSFLGFIDSALQYPEKTDFRVLTAYYCLPPSSASDLLNVETNKEAIAEKTKGYIEQYFQTNLNDYIRKVYMKPIGHAMPIPAPEYLLKDANDQSSLPNVIFAGVDNHRLPLFYEAVDSGLDAARRVLV